jgi:hypothetical protein
MPPTATTHPRGNEPLAAARRRDARATFAAVVRGCWWCSPLAARHAATLRAYVRTHAGEANGV